MPHWIGVLLIVSLGLFMMPKVTEFITLSFTARGWKRFAEENGLDFERGSFRLLGYSVPHEVKGIYKGRSVIGIQSHEDIPHTFGALWLSHLRVSSTVRPNSRARFSHNWLWMFRRKKSGIGDPVFERFIVVDSQPISYARRFLEDPAIRRLVKSLISPVLGPVRELRITKSGTIHLSNGRILTAKQLKKRFDILCDIAQRVEEVN